MSINTTKNDRPLDGFEQSLLGELRSEVAATAPADRRSQLRRRFSLAAAASALAVAGAGGIAATTATPAFAVTDQGGGKVLVTINELKDSQGLEKALAEHGVKAKVTFSNKNQFFVGSDDKGATPEGGPVGEEGVTDSDGSNDGGVSITSEDGKTVPPEVAEKLANASCALDFNVRPESHAAELESGKPISFVIKTNELANTSDLKITTTSEGADNGFILAEYKDAKGEPTNCGVGLFMDTAPGK